MNQKKKETAMTREDLKRIRKTSRDPNFIRRAEKVPVLGNMGKDKR